MTLPATTAKAVVLITVRRETVAYGGRDTDGDALVVIIQ